MLRHSFVALFCATATLLLHADELPPGVKDTQNAKDQLPSPEEAVKRFKVPDGFHVSLFACEPDVRQPIAMTFDDRGRLWVAECYSYPDWKPTGQDRILIFEDVDGDGRFDKRTVFLDKLANLSSILWGHGGIWACTAPSLVYIPDRNGDDKPDGPPEVILDGWSIKAKHNIVNGLAWGPDGWLYGCHGILSESKVGRPGDAEEKRTKINCGIWRYGPFGKGEPGALAPGGGDGKNHRGLTPPARQSQMFEVVAHGTTNPWGIDWNEHGEAFFVNCVIGHLWHLIPGARYKRMYGLDYNPHAYELIDATSDHLHWGGGDWTTSRGGKGVHGDAGGGHAHSGAMVYLGDNFPDEYRGQIFMANLHGNRLNVNKLERQGCGYVGKRGPDFLTSDNEWFRGVAIAYGPDGGVYVTDWCDHGECHDDDGVHRSSGRIYKVIYKPTHKKVPPFDLSKKSDLELVELLKHKNAWWARQAQRLLGERLGGKKVPEEVLRALARVAESTPDVTHKLRAMWTQFLVGGMTTGRLLARLEHPNEHIRSWAVRLLCDTGPSEVPFGKLAQMAEDDESGLLRLHLASILQRLPIDKRTPIAFRLWGRVEDADDPVLPLMLWYGMEAWVAAEKKNASTSIGQGRMGKITRFMIRRVCEDTSDPVPLEGVTFQLSFWDAPHAHLNGLQGLREALRGRKSVPMPKNWPDAEQKMFASRNPEVRDQALLLALVFDSAGAQESVLKLVSDTAAAPKRRMAALGALIEKQVPNLTPLLVRLLNEPPMRGAALRALAASAHADTPGAIMKVYPTLSDTEKQDAIATLAARTPFAHVLLDAVEKKQVPRGDVSAFTARQIQDLNDKELSAKLARVWGELRQTSAEKKKLIEDYKLRLSNDIIAKADVPNGKRLFEKNCAQCHKLHREGSAIGPDLTGSDRKNLHYVLENTLDPSAVVGRDYQLTNFLLHDGRLVAGIIVEETARAVTVQTANERLVLAKDDIDQRKTSKVSMMPEGLIEKLSADELRDLVGFLRAR